MIGSLVALMVKRYVTGDDLPFEMLGDLANLRFYVNSLEKVK